MSAAAAVAVLRCAGRALRRGPSSFTSKAQRFAVMPMEIVRPRRLLHCLSEAQPCMRVKDSTLMKLDQIARCLDRDDELMDRLEEAVRKKIKHDRRIRRLVRASILGTLGAAIYTVHHFFGGGSSRGQIRDHRKQ